MRRSLLTTAPVRLNSDRVLQPMPATITTPAAIAAARRQERVPGAATGALVAAAARVAVVGTIPPLGVASGSRSATNSSAVWKRSAGRFARQRMMTAPSAGESCGRCSAIGFASCVTCAASVCCGLSPWKGVCPVSIS